MRLHVIDTIASALWIRAARRRSLTEGLCGLPSRIVDRGRPGWTEEIEYHPSQLLVSLSSRARMKCGGGPKSAGNPWLLYDIVRFLNFENGYSILFFIREYTGKLTESLQILQPQNGEAHDRSNNVLRARSASAAYLGVAPGYPSCAVGGRPREPGRCRAIVSGAAGCFCAITGWAGITRRQVHNIAFDGDWPWQ